MLCFQALPLSNMLHKMEPWASSNFPKGMDHVIQEPEPLGTKEQRDPRPWSSGHMGPGYASRQTLPHSPPKD